MVSLITVGTLMSTIAMLREIPNVSAVGGSCMLIGIVFVCLEIDKLLVPKQKK